MFRCGVLVVVAGCAFKTPIVPDAAVDTVDASPDAPLGPCDLPALTMKVATLAGCAEAATTDGPRGTARFSNPVNVVISESGTAYVADFDGNRIRKIDATGRTSTLASLPKPFGLAIDAAGYLIVETDDDDMQQHTETTGTVWRLNPATGAATVLARDIGRPRGLAVLPDGRIAMADYDHHVVELLDPTTGLVTPLAGTLDLAGHTNDTGAAAHFAQPWDVVYSDGDLIVSEVDNGDLRRVTLTGVVTDVVAPGTLGKPQGLAIDASGAIYISAWQTHAVEKLKNGTVTTIAGGTEGYLDSDTPAQAQFYAIEGLDVTPDGSRIVVADGNHGDGMPFNHIRVIHQ